MTAARVVTDTTASSLAMFDVNKTDLQMEVLLDEGMHRHISFRKPGSSLYWFDLITWPGNLVIHGDMGTYGFSREPDMFAWFGTGPINPGYWVEKLTAVDPQGGVRAYNAELFWRNVNETLSDLPLARSADLRLNLNEAARWETDFEDRAQAFDAIRPYPEFADAWEWDVDSYTHHFLYNLHAIVWGIAQWRSR